MLGGVLVRRGVRWSVTCRRGVRWGIRRGIRRGITVGGMLFRWGIRRVIRRRINLVSVGVLGAVLGGVVGRVLGWMPGGVSGGVLSESIATECHAVPLTATDCRLTLSRLMGAERRCAALSATDHS